MSSIADELGAVRGGDTGLSQTPTASLRDKVGPKCVRDKCHGDVLDMEMDLCGPQTPA